MNYLCGMKKIFPLLLLVILITSCGNNEVLRISQQFNNQSWDRFDILNFEMDVEKDQLLDMDLLLTLTPNFKYDYLDLNITFNTPSGSTLSRNYKFQLNDKNGINKAVPNGEFLDYKLLIRKEMKFSKNGSCKIRVENKMTKITTLGIKSLGILAKVN